MIQNAGWKSSFFSILFLLLFFPLFSSSTDETRLLRFPTVHGNQVVFTYAGDLYTVGTDGGTARRLTSHIGNEMFPRFSPDGKSIAFTAQYDGNTEVYLVDARGGSPKRLTYTSSLSRDDLSDRMGPNNIVMAWKHDNKSIVFRSRMYEVDPFIGKLFYTNVNGDMHRQLPLHRGGFCSFSPDDSKLAYNQVFREFRSWKRYRGGMADDIWIYDFKTKKSVNITNNPAQDIIPMWQGHNIYFLSDRGPHERMNLYVYDTKTSRTRRVTDFNEYDIKFPSLGNHVIALENAGYIYLYDTRSDKLKKLTVHIREDRIYARGGLKNVKKNITDYHISPNGKRALFNARGDIFTVPAKYGNTRNLTRTSGIHERESQWSPDGKTIAFISDRSGEDEIHIISTVPGSKPVRVTTGGKSYKYTLLWSPDSKKIAWTDRKYRLRYVDIQTKKITDVARSKVDFIRSFNWSPDSRWLAYARAEGNTFQRIYLYSLDKPGHYAVTDKWYDSARPAFSSDGKYLYFVSDRDFNPIESEAEFRFAFLDMARIYLVTLANNTPSPLHPRSDEGHIAGSKQTKSGKSSALKDKKSKGKKSKKSGTSASAVPAIRVDAAGIADRIVVLPAKAAQYRSLVSVKNKLFYLRKGRDDKKTVLLMFDLEKRKEKKLGDIDGFSVSADFKNMLAVKGSKYGIIPLPSGKVEIASPLKLDNLETDLCLRCEWKNIFHESWRQMRDFFYVENMHGVDWEKMKKRYEPLVENVGHRNDLTYVIAEMIAELNVGHAYAGGGERPVVPKRKVGQLGAELERDSQTGYYRIKTIFKGQNWYPGLVSPLTAVGVGAREGDYVLSINGVSTAELNNPYKALNNTVGRQVRLTLNKTPSVKGSREAVVVPVADVRHLYYYNWVRGNIEKVDKASGGKIGYLNIPDMGEDGLVEFVKFYHPQLRKKALIIDIRSNGGGFVSELVLERLRREFVMVDKRRGSLPSANPMGMMYGPMVCLIDEYSASDGDLFPFRFRKNRMGTLIGKRTWGGVVGIDGTLPLLDGGSLSKPEYGSYDETGKKWLMEGYGVDPDIVVENDPADQFMGMDNQLNKAVEVLLEQLKTKEKQLPPPPPDPDKSVKKKE